MIKDDENNWNHILRGRDMTKERDQNFVKAHKQGEQAHKPIVAYVCAYT